MPESPRGAKENFGATWDWSLLTSSPSTEAPVKTLKKVISESDDNPPSEATEPDSEHVTEEKHLAEVPEKEHTEEEKEPMQNGKEDTPREEPEPAEPPAEEKHEENPETETTEEEKPHDEPPKEEEKTETEEKVENGDKEESAEHEEQTEEINTEKTETEPNTAEVNHDSHTEEKELEHEEEPKEDPHAEEHNKEEESVPAHHEEQAENPEHPVVNADEGVIEGIVNGENEIESVNEQGVEDKANDAEVVGLIEDANMEQLAALVLNGDGERLVGHHSENPELQAFLDNVPIYMVMRDIVRFEKYVFIFKL